ncbi:UNVERIFIED_CONTAM: hypothetical protein NCL1_44931 [Trichonephila clavipes]
MRSRYIKWLATEVLCLMKEDRMSRMNVEVGVPPHPQMKTTVLEHWAPYGSAPRKGGFRGVRYATAVHIYTFQDALFICYKQSRDNARSIAFSQCTNSSRFIEDEIFNDSHILNNLIHYEDGQEAPDSLRADKIHAGIQLSNKLEKHFLKIDTNSEKSMKFQKKLRSCISSYRDIDKKLTNLLSSQKLISFFMVLKNKSIEIVSLSDESDFEFIHSRKMSALNYDEYQ